ncbi:MAG: hypothetical protein D4R57_00530, partial [Verrucomicrobiales bacterium]
MNTETQSPHPVGSSAWFGIMDGLETLLSKASPGQWKAIWRSNDGRDQYSIVAANPEEYRKRVGTMFIAHTPNNHCCKSGHWKEIESNAEIMALATTVIPMLLAE